MLVSGTDGVGTKLKHRAADGQARHHRHRLRGHVRQRRHLLRRKAAGSSSTTSPAARTSRRRSRDRLKGVAEGCVQAGCALMGGETAEHPRHDAPEDEYDLAGFTVGVRG